MIGFGSLGLPRELSWEGYRFVESLELAVGGYYTLPRVETELKLEYYHQGSGEGDKGRYDALKVLAGEQTVLAKDYLMAYLGRSFLDYFEARAKGLLNLNDGSMVIAPELTYDVYNNLQLALGSFIFLGAGGSEFAGERILLGNPVDLTESFSLFARCKLSF